jgi:hypothetical protein
MRYVALLVLLATFLFGCAIYSSNVYKDQPFTEVLKIPEKLNQGDYNKVKVGDFSYSGEFDGGIYYSTWDFQVPKLVDRHPIPEDVGQRVRNIIMDEFNAVGYGAAIPSEVNLPTLTGQIKFLKIKSFITGSSPYDAGEIEIVFALNDRADL